MCRLVATATTALHPERAGGFAVVMVRCEEHGWHFAGDGAPFDGTALCPIGRIEKATEEALERIWSASRQPPPND